MADETIVAVFIDYENLAIGARAMKQSEFQIDIVLKRILEKGRIVFKRAYCDGCQDREPKEQTGP